MPLLQPLILQELLTHLLAPDLGRGLDLSLVHLICPSSLVPRSQNQ
jgi:hypothetical protein